VKKNTTHYVGFVSCFGFPCFTTLHFSTILFGPQNLSYIFYSCTKNTIMSTIVYTPKFVTTKENPKQASLQLILKPKVVLWYISFPFRFSCNFSWNVKVCLITYVTVLVNVFTMSSLYVLSSCNILQLFGMSSLFHCNVLQLLCKYQDTCNLHFLLFFKYVFSCNL